MEGKMRDFSLTIDVLTIADGQSVTFEGEAFIASVETPLGALPFVSPFRYEVTVMRNKEDLILTGSVSASLECPCVRCLETVELHISGKVEATYKHHQKKPFDQEEELEDLENVIYYEGFLLEISDRLIEALQVEIPAKVLCSGECKGLCPYCGENLNLTDKHDCKIKGSEPKNQLFDQLKKISSSVSDRENKRRI
jgi:uncharacterized protein